MQVGALWLREWCQQTAGGNSGEMQGDDSLALAVARTLLTKSAEQAATDLFELFGEDAIEQIQKLLERRYQSGSITSCTCLLDSPTCMAYGIIALPWKSCCSDRNTCTVQEQLF